MKKNINDITSKEEYNRVFERGNYLILTALMFPILAAMMMFAIEITNRWNMEQRIQDDIDAASLAGAALLPDTLAANARVLSTLYNIDPTIDTSPTGDVYVVSVADNAAGGGTIGVVVKKVWKSILFGGFFEDSTVSRLAVAVKESSSETQDFFRGAVAGDVAGGNIGMFLGANPPNPINSSSIPGNGFVLTGNGFANEDITAAPGASVTGIFYQNDIDLPMITIPGASIIGTGPINFPTVDTEPVDSSDSKYYDIVLDANYVNQFGINFVGAPLSFTRNGLGAPYMNAVTDDVGNNLSITLTGWPATPLWTITSVGNNTNVTVATQNALNATQKITAGEGVDIYAAKGRIIFHSSVTWTGAVVAENGVSKTKSSTSATDDFTSSNDFLGVAIWAGPSLDGDSSIFISDTYSNAQISANGLVYTTGDLNWAPVGNAVGGEETIKGMVWVKGQLTFEGDNHRILYRSAYDGIPIGGTTVVASPVVSFHKPTIKLLQ